MISNQIALKPFLQRAAKDMGMSYAEAIQNAARDAASVDPDKFLQKDELQGMAEFAKVLRVNPSQVAELQAEMAAEKVDPRMSAFFINNMVITAFAMEPGCAVALDGAMRLAMLEQPLPQSAVEDGILKLTPSVARGSQHLEAGEGGLVPFLAQSFKENSAPSEEAQFKLDATKRLASVIRLDEKEVEHYRTQFSQQGLSEEQTEGAVSSLVLNALAQEPTFENIMFNGITNAQMHNPEGYGKSFFEQA